jgi:hypothetical protein
MSILSTSASGAIRTPVTASVTSITLLAVNAARKGYAIWNNGTGILYVAHGAIPGSTTDYSYQIGAGSYYESSVDYTGLITGTWANTGGNALVTEFS